MLLEMLRVIAITTFVLVTVIAFGAVIKPLANESLLTASQAVKYVFLAMIPMLQYSLPFAAGFGSTLAMHRIANDNEIVAMSASGISYQVILGPFICLGIVLTLIMVLLTQSVIPKFYDMMGRALAGDVTEMIAYSVEKGIPFKYENMEIFAEQILIDDSSTVDTGADERIVLSKLIAAELDSDGRATTDVTAAAAIIDIYRSEDDVQLKIVMKDAVSWDEESKELRGFPRLEPTRALVISNPSQGETNSMSFSELLEAREHPKENYPQLALIHDRIINMYGDHLMSNQLGHLLESNGEVLFEQEPDRVYTITAAGVDGAGVFSSREGSSIKITEQSKGVLTRRFEAGRARLVRQSKRMMKEAVEDKLFNLELYDVQVEDLHEDFVDGIPEPLRMNARESLLLNAIQVPQSAFPPTGHMASMSIDELAEEVGSDESISSALKAQIALLLRKRGGLEHQIISRINRRFALSTTTLLLLVLGSVLALLLRHSMPLVIYMWAFLPALLNLVLISSGTSMVRSGSIGPGLVLLWSGNGLILLLIGLSCRKLVRH